MKPHRLISVLTCLLVLAACGEAADEPTTTTTTTTAAPETTVTTAAPETTSTTVSEEQTTTTEGAEATDDLARLQAAMSGSAEASRIEGTISVELPGGETAEMPMSLTVDPDTGDSSMSMDMAAMAQVGEGAEDVPPEMAEMMGTMEVREIGDTVYMRFPFFTAFLGAETEWVSMPAEEDDVTDDVTSGATPDDPGHFLESFSEVEGSVEELGTEEIRGISTTHYRLVVDENWQDELSEEQLRELEEQGPLPDASFPIDLWVDADGLVHRMSMDMDEALSGADDAEFTGMSMTFDFFDFGEPVTIEPPPADQVTDISELSGPMGTFQP